ncbi:DUF177 domain-containing protein [Novosphingobium sp.]|uniref:YceD family protein n=1 Tax=Novosphingobium sp. TaxID=1874826 RepID=UPI001EBD22F5|nr:DUF177 domain-containing protein [Novosphingobium sp.]MBK6802024.1 DUF177 domain-containing protein [Novosphingobium sp.]MBK9009365.1 DUF177 domain-containing protein [Novosphingobium sp.]
MSEFSRLVDIRSLPAAPIRLEAEPAECAALARRFDIVAIHDFEATVALEKDGAAIDATGRLAARLVQSCAVSGEDLAVTIDEPVVLRFVPPGAPRRPDEEVELEAEDCDEIEFEGTQFDLGEALAQSLALAIDPFLTGPGAEEARRKAGIVDEPASGPFAALKGLKLNPPAS